MDVVRSLMEKATALGKLEEMCNKQDAGGKTPFDMAAAGQHKVVMFMFLPAMPRILLRHSVRQERSRV